ncbi:MAG: T9SS type A sorting domain-containing protein [Flammeovirgaceae bacterium]
MRTYLLSLAILLSTNLIFAQHTRIIQGIVHAKVDPSEAILAVIFQTDQPSNKTVTGPDGQFIITVPNKKVSLTVKPINGLFKPKVIIVPQKGNYVAIGLEDLPEKLDAVLEEMEEDARFTRKEKHKSIFSTKPKAAKKIGTVERSTNKDEGSSTRCECPEELAKIITDKDYKANLDLVKNKATTHQKTQPTPQAGLLTAGEIDDFSKWKLWNDISRNKLSEFEKIWHIRPANRYVVQLTTEAGNPIIDATLQLKDRFGEVVWESRTDHTGKGELWNNLFLNEENEPDYIEATVGKQVHQIEKPTTFHKGINIKQLNTSCHVPDAVDIAFVVDATASMGDEIDYLKVELANIIERVKDSIPSNQIRLGSVFYRDYYDSYLTINSDLSEDISQTVNFIKKQSAKGGGDFPEAVDEGLLVALNELNWSESAKARLLFLVLDAPPHENSVVRKRIKEISQEAAKKGVRIIPVTASGIDKSAEYLMRSLALATNGTYTFLTDDSGIGKAHLKPTTDKYKVEFLNDLLVRLILEYTHSTACEPDPIHHIATNLDTVTHTDTLLTLLDSSATDTSSIDSTIIRIDPELVFTWKYYPNPTSGKITIELSQKVAELFITDVSGKLLMRIEPKTAVPNLIDLSAYPTGIYFIKFVVNGKRKFGRVLLRRTGRPER